jgi:hypothetical protein
MWRVYERRRGSEKTESIKGDFSQYIINAVKMKANCYGYLVELNMVKNREHRTTDLAIKKRDKRNKRHYGKTTEKDDGSRKQEE